MGPREWGPENGGSNMKARWILAAGVFFGFGLGFVVRDATTEPPVNPYHRLALSPEEVRPRDRDISGRGVRTPGRRPAPDGAVRPGGDRRERADRRQERSPTEALAAFKDALESGDRRAMHDALRDLSRRRGESLPQEALQELGSLLYHVDGGTLEELSRALAVSGGKEGAALVMTFVEDTSLSLEARERALHGLSRVPREMADDVLPALADFLESGAPSRLEHSAAQAIGNLFRDQAADVLLGLLEERPGIRPSTIFDALGNTGKLEDTETLLDMLSGDWDSHERMGLVRAIGRISTRQQNGELLLEMMRDPPAGISKSMVAHAIGDSSNRLDAAFLKDALLQVSGDRRAQERLARALAESGGKAGLDALLDVAGTPEYDFDRQALARVLNGFRGKEAVPLMMDMLRQSQDEEILEPLARGMLRHGTQETVDELMRILQEGSKSQRRAIVRNLHEVRNGSLDIDRLLGALRNERDGKIGSDLARSISRTYGDRGFQEVANILRDSTDAKQRQALMWGLEEAWRRNSPQARDLFVQLAGNDPVPDVRGHAVNIIEHRRDVSMIPALEQLLRNEADPEVQVRLRHAIRELGRRR